MSSYQTVRFFAYRPQFAAVARTMADAVAPQVGASFAAFEGSYSVVSQRTGETAGKILIYEAHLGRVNHGPVPLRNDGVYILVRRNGTVGNLIVASGFPQLSRCDPMHDIGVAPKHNERFGFFPVMAGEETGSIATFLAALVSI